VGAIQSSNVAAPSAAVPSPAASPSARPAPRRAARTDSAASSNGHSGDTLTSPLQGTVFKVAVEKGQTVQEGDLICVIEAMKMENEITAHKAGVVVELGAAVGAAVSIGDTLAVISAE
jgi:acetyl-CoA/propionyl-CoA carboxylase biotin carboxyl carrier protein